MPAIHTESFDQELRALLVSDETQLSELVSQFFYENQIGVKKTPLSSDDNFNFARSQLEQDSFYKIVVCLNFANLFDINKPSNRKLIDLLLSNPSPKIFIIRLSSKIDSPTHLLSDWKKQITLEDLLINYLYQNQSSCKLLMGLDTFDENRAFLQPILSMIQAIPNGVLLDPQCQLHPHFLSDFFASIKKELIRPYKNHFFVKGVVVTSEELCLKMSLAYKSIFGINLETLDLETSFFNRLEKKEDIVEATVQCELNKVVDSIVKKPEISKLGVKPELLSPLVDRDHTLTTQITKPFKGRGADFQFEPSVKLNKIDKSVKSEERANSAKEDKSSPRKTQEEKKASQLKNSKKVDKSYKKEKSKTAEPDIPSDDLEKRVGKLFTHQRTEQKTHRRSEKANIFSRIKRKSKNKQVIFLAGAILLAVGLVFGGSVGVLALNYRKALALTQKNLIAFKESRYSEIKTVPQLSKQAKLLSNILEINLIDNSLKLSKINQQLSEVSDALANYKNNSRLIYRYLLSSGYAEEDVFGEDVGEGQLSPNLNSQLDELKELLGLLTESLTQLQLELENTNPAHFGGNKAVNFSGIEEEIRLTASRLRSLGQLSSVLPELLAVSSKKHYHILLQDNQELRPTGGFLQAVAMIVVEEGKIIDHQIYTTNYIDSRALGQINPPAEVESFLGESRLHLRDANWDPNFASSAKDMSWFIREALNQPIDGFVGLNYNQVRELLAIFGSIDLPSYGGEITAQNLYSRLEANAAQEQDRSLENNIHTEILGALIEKLKLANDQEIEQVLSFFHQSLRDQSVALYFEDPQVGGVISELGWAGSIVQPECPSNFGVNCHTNYIYQVEANIGVNKVNQYVSSSVNHSIEIQESRINHHRKISYNNKARSSIWPLGKYRAYVRFYVDVDSQINEIRFNGAAISDDLIMEYLDHNRRVFGVIVDVADGEKLEVDLHYSTPVVLSAGSSYFFFEQSQPGVSRRLSTIGLKHPRNMEAELISPMVEVNQNQVVVASDVGAGFVAVKFADE